MVACESIWYEKMKELSKEEILEAFYLLFERIYNSGYNEARRNIEENPRDWGAY